MVIEESIFGCKRFDFGKMQKYGFIKTESGYRYDIEFLNGDFTAVLKVDGSGKLTVTVIDNMNNEEYKRLWIDSFQGGYVNTVRTAYEKLLNEVAEKCCNEVLSCCDQANRITELILKCYGVTPDYPFGKSDYENYGVFRHSDNLKWFALIMNVKKRVVFKNCVEGFIDIINLKSAPEAVEKLTEKDGIYPAYHMNRKHWISVALDDRLNDEEIALLIDGSFNLTKNKKLKKRAL